MHDRLFRCACGITGCDQKLYVMPPFTTTGPVTLTIEGQWRQGLGFVLSPVDSLTLAEVILGIPRR